MANKSLSAFCSIKNLDRELKVCKKYGRNSLYCQQAKKRWHIKCNK